MRRTHRIISLCSLAALVASACVSDLEDPSELNIEDSEGELSAAVDDYVVLGPDGEPLFPGQPILPDDGAIGPDAPCPGGCYDPPPCHSSPGLCMVDPYSGASQCWYPEVFNGMTCDNGNECTTAECVGGSCVTYGYRYDGFPCDDGDLSTVDDVCDGAGACEGTPTCPGGCNNPPPCRIGPGSCQVDPFSGTASCYYPPVFDGYVCDDGFECTYSECIDGSCVPYGYYSAGAPCNDGDPTTTGDVCDGTWNCEGTPFCLPWECEDPDGPHGLPL